MHGAEGSGDRYKASDRGYRGARAPGACRLSAAVGTIVCLPSRLARRSAVVSERFLIRGTDSLVSFGIASSLRQSADTPCMAKIVEACGAQLNAGSVG